MVTRLFVILLRHSPLKRNLLIIQQLIAQWRTEIHGAAWYITWNFDKFCEWDPQLTILIDPARRFDPVWKSLLALGKKTSLRPLILLDPKFITVTARETVSRVVWNEIEMTWNAILIFWSKIWSKIVYFRTAIPLNLWSTLVITGGGRWC